MGFFVVILFYPHFNPHLAGGRVRRSDFINIDVGTGNMLGTLLNVLGITWVGAVISLFALIVGVALSVWGVRKSNKRAQPAATLKTRRLVGGTGQALPENVEVLFDGQKVPRIARTLVHFWNAGDATLNGTDVVATDPMRLVYATTTEVLSVTVLKATRNALNIAAGADPAHRRNVQLSFDFLDPRDGALIEILHTGRGSPRFAGTVKGIPQGIWLPLESDRTRRSAALLTCLRVGGMFGVVAASVLGLLAKPFPMAKLFVAPVIGVALASLIAATIFELWQKRSRHPRSLDEPISEQTQD